MNMLNSSVAPELGAVPSAQVADCLRSKALEWDTVNDAAPQVLPELASLGLLGVGIPVSEGGQGGDVRDSSRAITEVASRSLTAAFVLWGQMAFIDYLRNSDNSALQSRLLKRLLKGQLAGAVGLSNVMKFLSQLEGLNVQARDLGNRWQLDGFMPWVSNVRPEGFVVAVAAQTSAGQAPMVFAIESTVQGVHRSKDLDLLGMRASNTAAIHLSAVELGHEAVLAHKGPPFLKAMRPRFLGMQCCLSLGLARASIGASRSEGRHLPQTLDERLTRLETALNKEEITLREGMIQTIWETHVEPLFQLRVRMAQYVREAMDLELQVSGGRGYLLDQRPNFARRWRESAFIPIITPSLLQLEEEMARSRR